MTHIEERGNMGEEFDTCYFTAYSTEHTEEQYTQEELYTGTINRNSTHEQCTGTVHRNSAQEERGKRF